MCSVEVCSVHEVCSRSVKCAVCSVQCAVCSVQCERRTGMFIQCRIVKEGRVCWHVDTGLRRKEKCAGMLIQ